MNTHRSVHIGDLITIMTGRLVSPLGISGIQDLLNWLTNDDIYTHQIPRAISECAPMLKERFPDLADITVPADLAGSEERVREWLSQQVGQFGATRTLEPLRAEDHTRIDPVSELRMKGWPQDRIVAVTRDPDA